MNRYLKQNSKLADDMLFSAIRKNKTRFVGSSDCRRSAFLSIVWKKSPFRCFYWFVSSI